MTDFGVDIVVNPTALQGSENGEINEVSPQSRPTASCGETVGERTQSSMRPNCKHVGSCKAKTSGKHCRPCSLSAIGHDPAIQARRKASFQHRLDTDLEFRAKHAQASAKRLMKWRKTEQAQELSAAHLGLARLPEYETKRREGISRHYLGWCPEDRRDEYQRLRHQLGAKEARRIIEAEIPGTREHAKIAVANARLAGRLKHQRDLEGRY